MKIPKDVPGYIINLAFKDSKEISLQTLSHKNGLDIVYVDPDVDPQMSDKYSPYMDLVIDGSDRRDRIILASTLEKSAQEFVIGNLIAFAILEVRDLSLLYRVKGFKKEVKKHKIHKNPLFAQLVGVNLLIYLNSYQNNCVESGRKVTIIPLQDETIDRCIITLAELQKKIENM